MSKPIRVEEHLARTVFGSMLMIVLLFVVLVNEEFEIIDTSRKLFGHSVSDLFNWGLISITFFIFFTFTLPSIVYLIKKIFINNDY